MKTAWAYLRVKVVKQKGLEGPALAEVECLARKNSLKIGRVFTSFPPVGPAAVTVMVNTVDDLRREKISAVIINDCTRAPMSAKDRKFLIDKMAEIGIQVLIVQ